jgi:exodeoxyribonuclease V alpha subunit
VLTDTTTAAAAYVAMTRGRKSNTAHLVAADLDDALEDRELLGRQLSGEIR